MTYIISNRLKSIGEIEINNFLNILEKGKDIIIYIHGFCTTYEQALLNGRKLESRLKKYTSFDGNIIVFDWRSQGELSDQAYNLDRFECTRSASQLAKLILSLNGLGTKVNIMSHSMGVFLLRFCIQELKEIEEKILNHVFLFAGDEDYNTLSNPLRMPQLRDLSNNMIIYFNLNDWTLWISRFYPSASFDSVDLSGNIFKRERIGKICPDFIKWRNIITQTPNNSIERDINPEFTHKGLTGFDHSYYLANSKDLYTDIGEILRGYGEPTKVLDITKDFPGWDKD